MKNYIYKVWFFVEDNEITKQFNDEMEVSSDSIYGARLKALARISNEFGLDVKYVSVMEFYSTDNALLARYEDGWEVYPT